VYAVLWNSAGRIAVVETPEGWFLPGGGIEPGEDREGALRREVAEECGLSVGSMRELGRAVEHVFVRSEDRCFRKEGSFFTATAGPPLSTPPEADHTLHWLAPGAAMTRLTHASQAWVLSRIVATLEKDRASE
jgi:8-oxo-dGTP diphosphatase